ncbi:MAG TPA: hypothetical protein VIP77_03920 [Jiangellaceae bacterium]
MYTLEVAYARMDDLRRAADEARRASAPRTPRPRRRRRLFR